MQTVTEVSLSGHSTPFRLDGDGYESLRSYFERARSRLQGDPDRDEILRDLEQSIGEKFVVLLRTGSRIIAGNEVDAVLRQIGTVDPGSGDQRSSEVQSITHRQLCRIMQGKWISGVCEGLAAYSGIGVAWVRTIFVLATVFTGGVVLLIYLAFMFALPVARTRDECGAMFRSPPRAT